MRSLKTSQQGGANSADKRDGSSGDASTGSPGRRDGGTGGAMTFGLHVSAEKDRAMSQAQIDTAHYIQRMAADLSIMASRVELDLLAYLLDMARIEAHDRARHNQSENLVFPDQTGGPPLA